MKNFSHFIIISFLFFISFDAQSSMVIKDIKKPVSVAWINDHEYVIGGENGCIRGQYSQNTPLLNNKKIITEEKVDHIAINKSKTLLGISLHKDRKGKRVLCNLEQNIVSDIPSNILSDYFNISIVFSSTHESLLAYKDGGLIQYDCVNKTIKKDEVPWSVGANILPLIDHHPIKNRFVYPSKNKKFTIINIQDTLTIQATIVCDNPIKSTKYSPDGDFIVIQSLNNQYFICPLNTNKNHIEAHALTHNNKEYIACAFHPKESIIVLLSTNAHIQYFNYITKQCIASIQTTPEKSILSIKSTNRLDICPQGKKLIAALNDECLIIDVPQNNILDAYKWLLRKEITTELRKYIFSLLISLHSKNMLYFNLHALLHVQPIDIIDKNESDTIESMKKPETIYVKLIGKKTYEHHICNSRLEGLFGLRYHY